DAIRFFSVEAGGVICQSCAKTAGSLILVQPREITQLGELLSTDIRQLDRLGVTSDNLQTLQKILRGFIEYRLDRPLKSQMFLDNILR
ncbi:MAG TPA: DNA repair protein RecO C-terminal domain-containing protein, partial [Bacillota bacterium]|nr:DNA repair protein RecO C-terminal domain-containing protein [Bacillota bacterium]